MCLFTGMIPELWNSWWTFIFVTSGTVPWYSMTLPESHTTGREGLCRNCWKSSSQSSWKNLCGWCLWFKTWNKLWKNWKLIIIMQHFVIFEVSGLPFWNVLEWQCWLNLWLHCSLYSTSIGKLWEAEELQLLTYLLFSCNIFKLHLESKLKNSPTMIHFFKGYI